MTDAPGAALTQRMYQLYKQGYTVPEINARLAAEGYTVPPNRPPAAGSDSTTRTPPSPS